MRKISLNKADLYLAIISICIIFFAILGFFILNEIEENTMSSKNASAQAEQNTQEILENIEDNYQRVLDDHRLQQRFIDCIIIKGRPSEETVKACKDQAQAPIRSGTDLFDRSSIGHILKENEKER